MKPLKIKPLYDRLVIKRLPEQEKTAGGLVIPESAKERPIGGEVVAVGSGKSLNSGKTQPLDVQVGQRVLFGKYAGTEIELDGEQYLILKEDEIVGIVETK